MFRKHFDFVNWCDWDSAHGCSEIAIGWKKHVKKKNKLNKLKMSGVPKPAPASKRNDPHSHATCRGRGSAQTTNVKLASSPFRTDIV